MGDTLEEVMLRELAKCDVVIKQQTVADVTISQNSSIFP